MSGVKASAKKRPDQWLHHQAIQIAAQLPADPNEADAILDRVLIIIRCMQLVDSYPQLLKSFMAYRILITSDKNKKIFSETTKLQPIAYIY